MDLNNGLKYASIALMFVIALSGYLGESRRSSSDQRTVLTTFGKIGIGSTVVLFLFSLGSVIADDRKFKKEETKQRQREAARQRDLILSGQQLRSLSIRWTFYDVDQRYLDAIAAGEKKVESAFMPPDWYFSDRIEFFRPLFRRLYKVYPWISSMTTGEWSEPGSCLLLLALDETRTAVIPFGIFDDGAIDSDPYHRMEDFTKDLHRASATVERLEPIVKVISERDLEESGLTSRPRYAPFGADVTTDGRNVTLSFDLPPHSFLSSIDKAAPELIPTLALPDYLEVVTMTQLRCFPMEVDNFTRLRRHAFFDTYVPSYVAPWDLNLSPMRRISSRSEMVLEMNNLHDWRVTYKVERIGDTEPDDLPLIVTKWRGTRVG